VYGYVPLRHFIPEETMTLNENYDVIVAGGGPAGSLAAYAAAKEGVRVLLLEKDREIGSPVRCAEAVGQDGLEKILDQPVKPQWIAATIKRFKFVAPDGSVVHPQVPMTGYVLHRKLFDVDLAAMAATAGAQVLTGTAVTGLLKKDGRISGVICRQGGRVREITAPMVIGADGVESRIGRWAGIDTTVAMRDMETCSQVTLATENLESDTCVFYFSQDKFPGGYAWLFPKGNGQANLGLGIAGDRARKGSANARLEAFIKDNFSGASILGRTVGGVPCANRLPVISAPGLLLAGDAALQANPASGGGIATGMTAGKLAGRIAALAVKTGDVSTNFLRAYEKEWDKVCGQAQKRYYRLKEGISRLSDEQLNRTAHDLQKVPAEKQTLVKIFQVALAKQPSLLVDILKTLSPFSSSNI